VSRTARWLRSELVAEVTFAEWTDGGTLRHPSYITTRDDKGPDEVVRELTGHAPSGWWLSGCLGAATGAVGPAPDERAGSAWESCSLLEW
jgi:hypothetical protein